MAMLTIMDSDAEPSSPKLFRPMFEKLVIILVGPEEQRFAAHEDLLCNRSIFFNAACSKHWAETTDKVVRLPERHADVFRSYLERVYDLKGHLRNTVGRIVEAHRWKYKLTAHLSANLSELVHHAMHFWVLGDYLHDVSLTHEAMDVLIESSRSSLLDIRLEDAKLVMTRTACGCGLQRWLADYLAFVQRVDYGAEMADSFPAELVRLVLKRSLPFCKGHSTKMRLSRGHYNDHPKGVEGCA